MSDPIDSAIVGLGVGVAIAIVFGAGAVIFGVGWMATEKLGFPGLAPVGATIALLVLFPAFLFAVFQPNSL